MTFKKIKRIVTLDNLQRKLSNNYPTKTNRYRCWIKNYYYRL